MTPGGPRAWAREVTLARRRLLRLLTTVNPSDGRFNPVAPPQRTLANRKSRVSSSRLAMGCIETCVRFMAPAIVQTPIVWVSGPPPLFPVARVLTVSGPNVVLGRRPHSQ